MIKTFWGNTGGTGQGGGQGSPGSGSSPDSGAVRSARLGMSRRQLFRFAAGGAVTAVITNRIPGQASPQITVQPPITSLVLRDVAPSPLRMDQAAEVRAAFVAANGSGGLRYRIPPGMDPAALAYCVAVQEAIARASGLGGHSVKSQAGRLAKEWLLVELPLPPVVDALIIPFLQAAFLEKVDRNKLAKEGMKYASDMVQRYLNNPDDCVGFEARFQKAPPWEKAQVFVAAAKRMVNDRIWPTAFSQYLTINPLPGASQELMERFSPGSSAGWGGKDQAQRTEAVRTALGEYLNLAERLASDAGTQADYDDLATRDNFKNKGWTGTKLLQAILGDDGVKAAEESDEARTKTIRAAAAFAVVYEVCLATHW